MRRLSELNSTDVRLGILIRNMLTSSCAQLTKRVLNFTEIIDIQFHWPVSRKDNISRNIAGILEILCLPVGDHLATALVFKFQCKSCGH